MTNREIDTTITNIRAAREHAKKLQYSKDSTPDQIEQGESLEKSITTLVDGMCAYTKSVFGDNFKNANRPQLIKEANTAEEFRRKCEEIERERKSNHDHVILTLKFVDLLCRECNIDEIYGNLPKEYQRDVSGLMGSKNRGNPGVVKTRHDIAEWIWGFVVGTTVEMCNPDIDYNKDPNAVQELYHEGEAKKMILELTNPHEDPHEI